jgi:hypothetical protein
MEGGMTFSFVRGLRTPHSERFIVVVGSADAAVVELHHLLDGTVEATLIVFEGSGIGEGQVHDLLAEIDRVLLPAVSLDDHKLRFTVVMGRVLGSFEPERTPGA